MRIRLSLVLEVTRGRRDSSIDDPGSHRDLDTLVERAEPRRIGFEVPSSAEPYDPDQDDRHERRG